MVGVEGKTALESLQGDTVVRGKHTTLLIVVAVAGGLAMAPCRGGCAAEQVDWQTPIETVRKGLQYRDLTE
jgi:hypothetical protein